MKQDNHNGLTRAEIKNKVMRLHPGDTVEIMENGKPVVAVLERIYPNIVQFRKKNGLVVTLDYFSAMNANVIKPSVFEKRNAEMEMDDIADAVSGIS